MHILFKSYTCIHTCIHTKNLICKNAKLPWNGDEQNFIEPMIQNKRTKDRAWRTALVTLKHLFFVDQSLTEQQISIQTPFISDIPIMQTIKLFSTPFQILWDRSGAYSL